MAPTPLNDAVLRVVRDQLEMGRVMVKARAQIQQQYHLSDSTSQSSLLVQALNDMSHHLSHRAIKNGLSARGREAITGLPTAFDEAFKDFMSVLSGQGPLETLGNPFDLNLAGICPPVVDQYHALKQAELALVKTASAQKAADAPHMELTNQVEGRQGIPHDGRDCDINCAECFLDLDESAWKDLSLEDMKEALTEAGSRLTHFQTVDTGDLSLFLDRQLVEVLRPRLKHPARSAPGNETRGSLELRQGDWGSSCSESEYEGDTPATTTLSLAKKMAEWKARISSWRFGKKAEKDEGEPGTASTITQTTSVNTMRKDDASKETA